MATISIAGRSVPQGLGTGTSGFTNPHMEKVTVTTGNVYRVLPDYPCDTWEIYLVQGTEDPMVRVFGLDDDYANTATAPATSVPAAGTKFELNIENDYENTPKGFDMATLSTKTIIVDQAWQGLQFDVEEKAVAGDPGTVVIKVKAYRAGKCTFDGTFAAGTTDAS